MSIGKYLDKIRNAVYGREVRESIAKGIETAYNDAAEKHDNANMEVKLARGTHSNLNNRLKKMDEVDEQSTAQLAQTIKKGQASVFDIDKNKGLLDETFMTDKFLQQMAGDAPIHTVPADDSITLEKLTFSKQGKNLFNKNDVVHDRALTSNGGLMVNDEYSTSGYFIIKPSFDYALTNIISIRFYDVDKEFVSHIPPIKEVVTSPLNAMFARVSVRKENLDTAQVEEGEIQTAYEPFRYYIPKRFTQKHDFDISEIKDRSIEPKQTTFLKQGKNLFDKRTTLDGLFVNHTNGKLNVNNAYYASDFIKVEEETSYSLNVLDGSQLAIAYYTEDEIFISGVLLPSIPFKTPKNASLLRFSVTSSIVSKDILQLEQNTTQTSYEPFGLKFPDLLTTSSENKDEVPIHLPSEVCVAVGRTIELYNKQVIWAGNYDDIHIQWVSNIGKPFERKWSFEGTDETIGEHDLNIRVYDNNMKLITSATTTIKVVSNEMTKEVNLLTIGDSLTNNKPWISELEVLSDNKIVPIGTRLGKHEGRSGARADWYLKDSTYTYDSNYDNSNPEMDGTENPFWNPDTEQFDFNYYKETYDKHPDAVQIFLGTNGIDLDPTTNVDSIKKIVDGIQESDSTIPIFVVNTLYRSGQDGMANQASNDGYSAFRSAWKLQEDRKVFNLMVKLDELLHEYDHVHFVPIALTHDSEYNFGQKEVSVNPRSEVKTTIPIESVHPQREGYMQMADIMFGTIIANVCANCAVRKKYE